MRLASFNILHGRSPADGLVVPSRLADSVRRLDADVLALQEVDFAQPRSNHADLTKLAADAMGAEWARFVATVAGTPGDVWTAATGEGQPASAAYGIALLSRWPVRQWQVTRLPSLPLPVPVVVPGRRGPILTRDEPRAALAAVVDSPVGQLTVITTHLSFVPGWNTRQLRRLLPAVSTLPAPRVLLGDLNMPADAVHRITRWRALVQGATFPAAAPAVQLDHVLADGAADLIARHVERIRLPISDHLAVVTDVEPVHAAV